MDIIFNTGLFGPGQSKTSFVRTLGTAMVMVFKVTLVTLGQGKRCFIKKLVTLVVLIFHNGPGGPGTR